MNRLRWMILLALVSVSVCACQPLEPLPAAEEAASTPSPEWVLYTMSNSEFPGPFVLALATAPDGAMWIG